MTFSQFFAGFKEVFYGADVSDIHEHLAFQFNIIGEAEGIFYVEVKDGQLFIEPYEYFDRDAMFIAEAEVFKKMAEGKLDSVQAFLTGKLKVEGNIDQALKFKDIAEKNKKRK